MSTDELYKQIKECLKTIYADQLEAVVVYGSQARQEQTPDSDIDVLVLLNRDIDYGRDLERNIQALYPLSMQINRRISAKPVNADAFRNQQCPLYNTARQEGIRI